MGCIDARRENAAPKKTISGKFAKEIGRELLQRVHQPSDDAVQILV
jgi:hypothetical protein